VWAGLWLGVPAVRDGALSGVALAVVVLTPLAVFELVAALTPAAQQVPRVRAAAARVFEVIDAPVPVVEPIDPDPLPAPPSVVRVDDVSARWTSDGPTVLLDADLTLTPREHVALLGPSGVGKSTLAAVLLKFLTPTGGTVSLDGTPYARLDGDQVRTRVGLLAQDAHVFDTSVLENVRLARPGASDEQIRAALRAARLLPSVEAMPDGWHTMVGEHGGQLSGGERQRLALARALLAHVEVLVLDEPTEHVDEATASRLLDDLLATTTEATVLLITHRDVSGQALDRVLTLRAGRLEE
ncbi:MAG: ATP-binding cassette domain-containing protein, partial [Jiangellales bacterium]